MEHGYPEEEIEKMRNELRGIAQKQGETVEELREVLEEYIACAYSNPDPRIQKRLRTCPRAGELPTPEEFLLWFLPQAMVDWED